MAEYLGGAAQLITAIVLALTWWQSRKNGQVLKDVKEQTDGLTSALVVAKSEVATAHGTAAGIVEGHAAGLEQGRNEERVAAAPSLPIAKPVKVQIVEPLPSDLKKGD